MKTNTTTNDHQNIHKSNNKSQLKFLYNLQNTAQIRIITILCCTDKTTISRVVLLMSHKLISNKTPIFHNAFTWEFKDE